MALAKIQTRPFDRSASVIPESVDEGKRLASFTFSSEFPVERCFGLENGGFEYGLEVLDHSPTSADLRRLKDGGAVRDTHHGDQVGVVRDAVITEERKGKVDCEYGKGKRSEEIFQDVISKIRRNVSFRYKVRKYVREANPDPKNPLPIYRATDWEAIHVSHEPDAADPSVGVDRSAKIETEIETVVERSDVGLSSPSIITNRGEKAMNEEERKALELKVRAEAEAKAKEDSARAISDAQKRSDELHEYVERWGHVDGVRQAVDEARKNNTPLQEVGRKVLDLVGEVRCRISNYKPQTDLGMNPGSIREYSMSRAIAMAGGLIKREGVEMEAHAELLKRGLTAGNGGILIPHDIQSRKTLDTRLLDRTQTAGTGSAGGYLVSQSSMGFIEMLRNRSVLDKLGVPRLSGLRDNVYMPKQSGASTLYWVAEGGATTASTLTFGQVAMQPKTASALVEMSRQLLIQSNPSIEAKVMADLSKVVALGTDLVGLSGVGGSGQPLGLFNTSGVGSFTGTNITWPLLLTAQTDVEVANADEGTLKWLMTPGVKEILMQREKATGYPVYLMGEDQKMLGYQGFSSNQCPSAGLVLGDWSQMVIGEWGVMEITARTSYANPNTGAMEVITFISVDTAVTQPTAFTIASVT